MMLASKLFSAREHGVRDSETERIACAAFDAELSAAALAFDRGTSVVTRIVLLRSVANLAREARQWSSGIDLVLKALSTEDLVPHRAELLRVLDTLRTYEHLEVAGISLSDSELQLSLAGAEAGPGFARADEVTRRVESVRALLVRNTMRQAGLPFKSSESAIQRFRSSFTPYLSMPRAASYAITMRFGVNQQSELALDDSRAEKRPSVVEAIDEVIRAAKVYASGGPSAIARLIDDSDYAKSTSALLRHLSPDESRIQTVGLTIMRNGRADPIALPPRTIFDASPPSRVPMIVRKQALPPRNLDIVGQLLEGNAKRSERAYATIVEDSGAEVRVWYDEATHGDIIDGYWKHHVRVSVRRGKRAQFFLLDITDA